MGFAAAALADVGQQLGIGALQRASVAGDGRACVVALAGEFVVTAAPRQAAALATVEKAVDAAVHGKV
jgi:pectin methylesterase-like acyl-CoA thioesterase